MGSYRTFMTRFTSGSMSRRSREYRILSRGMGSMKRRTTEPSQIVRYFLFQNALRLRQPDSGVGAFVAYAIISSTATNPQCPQGLMQFQHGTYDKADNGSLTLTPFAVDGRQLLSTPCKYQNSIYTRWNVTELFQVRTPSSAYDVNAG